MKARSILVAATAAAVCSTPPAMLGAPAVAAADDCTVTGTSADDVLRGTPRRDVICGRGGADVLKGRRGNDVLRGGKGRDDVYGGRGDDVVAGGPNADLIACGRGTDTFVTDGLDDVRPSCEQEGVGNGQPDARTAGAHDRP